jgi:hypothetical protein
VTINVFLWKTQFLYLSGKAFYPEVWIFINVKINSNLYKNSTVFPYIIVRFSGYPFPSRTEHELLFCTLKNVTLFHSGGDPSAKYGLHYCAIEMAAEQGAFRALRAAINSLPEEPARKKEDLMNDILFVLFSTSCYECIMGTGVKCQRCVHDSIGHAKDASFTACVDVVMETGHVPSRKYLIRLHQCSTFKQELFDYILTKAIKVSPSLKELNGITSEEAWRNMCSVCGEEDVKTKRCSGCKNIRYCSQKCQRADWKNHKRVCY